MTRHWRQTLLVVLFVISMLLNISLAFYKEPLRGQNKVVQHKTPEEVWSEKLKRRQEAGEKTFPEEEEIIKMCLWMSYLTDKVVTVWLQELDNRWYPLLAPYEPIWPRCVGGVNKFLDLNPPRREGIDESLRWYVIVEGVKDEIVSEPPLGPYAPWSGVWGLAWQNNVTQKRLEIYTDWFHYPDILGKVHRIGKMWEWPTGERASYSQIHGYFVAAIIDYAIKHGSFSGPIVGDDSFFIIGSWFKTPKGEKYSEFKDIWLMFKKYNFRVTIKMMPISDKSELATDAERNMVEKIARLVEAQIISYSLFGLDKFTVLKVVLNGQEFYLPAGWISSGNYLMPVKYALESVIGEKSVYNATERKMGVELRGQKIMVHGELIEATNQRFKIPDEERFVTRWETLRELLGLEMVQDIRFEK